MIVLFWLIPTMSFAASDACLVSLNPAYPHAERFERLNATVTQVNSLLDHVCEMENCDVRWEFLNDIDFASYSPRQNLMRLPESLLSLSPTTQSWVYARALGAAIFSHTRIFAFLEPEAKIHKKEHKLTSDLLELETQKKVLRELEFTTKKLSILKQQKSLGLSQKQFFESHQQEFLYAASNLFSDVIALLIVGDAATWAESCSEVYGANNINCLRWDFRNPAPMTHSGQESLDFDYIRNIIWKKYVQHLRTDDEINGFVAQFILAVQGAADTNNLRDIAPGDIEAFNLSLLDKLLNILIEAAPITQAPSMADQNREKEALTP